MFKKLNKIIELKLSILEKQMQEFSNRDKNIEKEWHLETGKMFNDLINRYPILEEELLSMSETVCKFVMYTRKTNIDKYLFKDEELTQPRLPMDFK